MWARFWNGWLTADKPEGGMLILACGERLRSEAILAEAVFGGRRPQLQ
jgi:hypothetical protein